jgi:hypothetical protein
MRKYIALLIPALVAAVIVTGCGGGSSKTVSIPGGGQVSVSDKIPDSFPKDFPVYKGASVKGSYTGNSNGISGTVVTWETGDSVQKVKDFYDSALKDSSYSSTSSGDTGGSSFWAGESKDGKKAVYVMVTTENNKTSIIATVGDKPADSSSSSSGSDSSSSSSNDDKTATAEAESSGSSSSSGAEKSPTASPLPAEVTLAKDFPTDRVPLPSGARVTSSSSFGSGGSKTFMIEYYTKDAPDKAAEYFSTELPKHGWADSFSSNQNGEYFVTFTSSDTSASSNDGVTVNASASETSGYTKVGLTVSMTSTP